MNENGKIRTCVLFITVITENTNVLLFSDTVSEMAMQRKKSKEKGNGRVTSRTKYLNVI